MTIKVRSFQREDVPDVLSLMRALAIVEGYSDRFAVTEAALIEHGFGSAPKFGVLLAETGDRIVGIAVHYVIPWTYDLKPTLVLKELFVDEDMRRFRVGEALFMALGRLADRIGAARISWTVLPANDAAKRFYRALGGAADTEWENWILRRG